MLEILEMPFAQRALLAAMLIGFSNGALGALLVLRKNALVVSALSHALLPGIALGLLTFGVLNPLVGFTGAFFSVLIVGLGTVYVSRAASIDHQTALSVLYTTAFAAGLLLLDLIPQFVPLESWLFGNILAIRNADLWLIYAVSLIIVLCLILGRRPFVILLYEASIAASMGIRARRLNDLITLLMVLGLVTSLQAVGAVLSAALFITPAAIGLQWFRSPRSLIWGSGLIGSLSACLALILSVVIDVRPGSMIILVLGAVFLLALLTQRKNPN